MGSGDPPTGAAAASTCFPLHFDQLSSWLAATVNLSPWFLGPSAAPWNLPSGLVGFRGLPESQHGCGSLCSHLSPSSIYFGKAPVQQLWYPCQRAGRSSKSDFLPAREVPKYSNPAWRAKM